MRQSMPSSNIDSWAGVSETRPVSVTGHWKWPFSSRLLNRVRGTVAEGRVSPRTALPVEPKEFNQPAAFTAKGEQRPAERVFRQHLLGQHRQSVHPFGPEGPRA